MSELPHPDVSKRREERSTGRDRDDRGTRLQTSEVPGILRKEVIQPQVPLRLPCYDFTPVADLTVVG